MPLDSASLSGRCVFSFTVPVSGWADLTQGNNQISFGATSLATDTWDEAFAAVLSVAGGGSTTIDLTSVTNLAGESVVLTAVLAAVVKAVPTVAADSDIAVTIGPGVSNGLEWLAGANDVPLAANEAFVRWGDPDGAGFTVDSTHKTLKVANTGADDATVTVVIIGTTL